MQGVGIIMTLIIGALAGWIAEKITRSEHGIFVNMLLGIVGAFVVSFLASLAGFPLEFGGWFWGNLITATVGAVLLIVVYRAIKR